MQNVREPSPPRTPSRRNASMESSPNAPVFEDVAWGPDGKRRRVERSDVLTERPAYDSRRPSVIDPSLSTAYSSPRASAPPPGPFTHHHRPSLPHPQAALAHQPVHSRHQSSPVPQGHAAYHPQHAPGMIAPAAYTTAPAHHYEHRPSYYQDVHPSSHGHPYDRAAHESYYPRAAYSAAPHPSYAQESYHHQPQPYSYTFQSTLGVDQNSFNRKRRGNLPKEATGILKAWFSTHRESPYPTEDEKMSLCQQTGLTLNQVCPFPALHYITDVTSAAPVKPSVVLAPFHPLPIISQFQEGSAVDG
jgi:hypothetical protein